MSALFLKLVNLSISASWLVLAVLVFRAVFRKAPKWSNVLLWGVVALRLLLPFSIESPASLLPSGETVRTETAQAVSASAEDTDPTGDPAPRTETAHTTIIHSGVRAIDNAVNPVLRERSDDAPNADSSPRRSWTEWAGRVWLAGMAVMLAYAGISYFRLRRRVRVSLREEGSVYLCDEIATPFILGVVRPRIYLPSAMDGVQKANVLAHERAHLARRDHWWKPLGYVLLAVYWFNPVLWAAYILLCRDIELACDEKVVRNMDTEAVKVYSAVLLACSMPRKLVTACPLAFGEVGVKERVKRVLSYKEPAFWAVAVSLIACIAAAVCFLTDPERNGTMEWAQELQAEDIVNVELTAAPQSAGKQYRIFSADEIPDVVTLLNKSRGRRVAKPEELAGGAFTLYITTADGVRHTVGNEGNVYLRIDGDTYKPGYSWLSAWPYTEGNAPLPEGFFDGPVDAADAGTGVMAGDRFYTKKWSIRVIGNWEKGGFCWKSPAETASSLQVDRRNGLVKLLGMLKMYGTPVEEVNGYYHYIEQEGPPHYETYLYPVPNSEDYYCISVDWGYDGIDPEDPQLLLEQKQMKLMAESFRVTELVNDLTVVPLTGYEAYDALIARVADVQAFAEGGLYNHDDEEHPSDFSDELLNTYYQTTGWTLRDLDGDGTPELILGGDWGDGYTPIFNIYKLEDGKAVRVLYGWARNCYDLCTNGTISNHYSNGAGDYGDSYYRYKNGELQHLETVQYYGYVDEGVSPWNYSDASDDFYSFGRNFREISEQEAERIEAKYEEVTLDYTPFTTEET